MFKDEVGGKQITHFVALRPKLYSFKVEIKETDKIDKNNKPLIKKCKGIKKNVVKKGITFEDYVKCLFSGEKQMRSMKILRSENHDICSKEVRTHCSRCSIISCFFFFVCLFFFFIVMVCLLNSVISVFFVS